MSLRRSLAALALAAVGVLALLPGIAAAQAAATLLAAIGEVRILDAAGQSRAGERGDALATGERVAVGANGLAQLRFSDGGLVSLRANSELSIDAYAYQGERDTAASSVLQLVRGGLRAITGAIARLNRGGYTVVTTNATIGVRGTDFEVFHISPPVPSGETLPGEPGTYLKVNQGTAFLQTQGGSLDVLPQQVAVALQAAAVPRLLPQMPTFMRGVPPTPTPPQQPQPRQQRSEQPMRAPGALSAPTVDPRTLHGPASSPTLTPPTSPTLAPALAAPDATSPTLSPSLTNPTAPSPALGPGTASPTLTAPATTSPTMTAPATTSPTMTAPVTGPGMTAPVSPGMTAPR